MTTPRVTIERAPSASHRVLKVEYVEGRLRCIIRADGNNVTRGFIADDDGTLPVVFFAGPDQTVTHLHGPVRVADVLAAHRDGYRFEIWNTLSDPRLVAVGDEWPPRFEIVAAVTEYPVTKFYMEAGVLFARIAGWILPRVIATHGSELAFALHPGEDRPLRMTAESLASPRRFPALYYKFWVTNPGTDNQTFHYKYRATPTAGAEPVPRSGTIEPPPYEPCAPPVEPRQFVRVDEHTPAGIASAADTIIARLPAHGRKGLLQAVARTVEEDAMGSETRYVAARFLRTIAGRERI